MSNQRGFTLIELMIAVGLLAFLVMAAAPLSGAWVRGADVQSAEGDFTQAIGRAKASALRNYSTAVGNAPSAAVCVSGTNEVSVFEGTAGSALDCADASTGSTLWKAQLNSHVTVTAGGNAVSCICFDNKGAQTTAGACSACLSDTELTFTAGSQVETVTLF